MKQQINQSRAALAAFDIWLAKFPDREAEEIGLKFNALLDKNTAKFIRDFMDKKDKEESKIKIVKG